jgi:hypothetical protein
MSDSAVKAVIAKRGGKYFSSCGCVTRTLLLRDFGGLILLASPPERLAFDIAPSPGILMMTMHPKPR